MTPRLDIVIPVYNEGPVILATLEALRREVKTPARVLICYDKPDDNTLTTIAARPDLQRDLAIEFVLNKGRGAHGAVMTGFAASTAPYILMYPADDDYNPGILDGMVAKAEEGNAIVCASRFMPGGCMVDCPWLKSFLVRTANFTLHHFARVPTRDASNGFRMFSRRVIDGIKVESDSGFCYSIELLVKTHRLGWRIGEVPARWFERRAGESRFRVVQWIPAYLRWYAYAFATTLLRLPASTVPMREALQRTH